MPWAIVVLNGSQGKTHFLGRLERTYPRSGNDLRLVDSGKLTGAVVHLVVAAGVPLLAMVATQIPLSDLARWIAGAIL
jgi:hypothetical protein